MSTYPGVYIVEKSTLTLGTSGMSGLTPLLIGRFKKKDTSESTLKDGLTYIANFTEFADKFLSAPLVVTLTQTGALPTPPAIKNESTEDSFSAVTDDEDAANGSKGNEETIKPKAKKTTAKNAKAEALTSVSEDNDQVVDESETVIKVPPVPVVLSLNHLNLSALAVANYFNNGGAPCYLLSLGADDAPKAIEAQISEYSELSLLAVIDAQTPGAIDEVLGNFITANPQSFLLAALSNTPATYVNPERVAVYTPNLRLSSSPSLYDESIFIEPDDSTKPSRSLLELQAGDTEDKEIYTTVKAALAYNGINYSAVNNPIISPLAAVAGAYCKTERSRGIWKAPANISLVGATPTKTIGKVLHGELNQSGVNAIIWQASTGTAIMGARTQATAAQLAWRYIPVRLLFSTVERDIRNMLSPVVFEPNSAATWQSVLAAINNYLYLLWKKGGLYGNTPQKAFQASLALEEDDIDNGILRVRVGLAALRPVEFIYLEFTQDMPVTA